MSFSSINERFAAKITASVGTMTCAYIFCIIALISLPETIQETFASGFHPLPLVTWISQNFLQLTLLAIIMAGQSVQAKATEQRDVEQYNAVMETLADVRDDHATSHEILEDVQQLLRKP